MSLDLILAVALAVVALLALTGAIVVYLRSRRVDREEAKKPAAASAKAKKKKKVEAAPASLDDAGPIKSGIVPRDDSRPLLPTFFEEEDGDPDLTRMKALPNAPPVTLPFVYDGDAEVDEPTGAGALILTVGYAQTDAGKKRKRNEDSLLVSEKHHLYVVADGMGGHRGGDVASKLAVEALQRAFDDESFADLEGISLPRRARELVSAINRANAAVHERAKNDVKCHGMGTTLSAARFAPKKQRLYIGHVGDSRVYRVRNARIEQMTSDHTMQSLGFTDAPGSVLSRALGVDNGVAIDVIMAKPLPGDVYLLCSDGLTKMVPLETITSVLDSEKNPKVAVQKLVERANEAGGHDNVTVIIVRVDGTGADVGRRAAS
jgi:serine/threonine protein phosphatase PrpC